MTHEKPAAARAMAPPPTSTPRPAAEPDADEGKEELTREAEAFIRSLNLGAAPLAELANALTVNEIFDLDTMRLLTDEDWSAIGVKLGIRRKMMARLGSI